MEKDTILTEILRQECINTVFQPVVSLENGSVFGYEALSRIVMPACKINIEALFQMAHQQDRLWDLEKLCRIKALKSAAKQPLHSMLFLNVDANIFHDPKFHAGFTVERLNEYGIAADSVIIEITEHNAADDLKGFTSSVHHYQDQRFKIAIDDFGSAYSGLNRVCSLSPEFLKIDMNLIRDIDKDALKRSAVAATVDFCRQSGIKVIAEGIQTAEELRVLIRLGVDFGQGYYLCHPDPEFKEIAFERKLQIKEFFNQTKLLYRPSIFSRIADLGTVKKTTRINEPTFGLFESMRKDSELSEFFVVDEKDHVCGILTRRYVFERYGGQYGYNLSKRLQVKTMMLTEYLAVDEKISIDKVAELAMRRSADRVYDSIAITRNGKYLCTVTVKDLLLTSIQLQVQRAIDANPLTGLPGNHEIQRVIGATFQKSTPWAIIYLDLDNFKAYNDAYGFSNGDAMLKAVADVMRQCSKEDDFLGHIGGDDFVIVTDTHDVIPFCRKIAVSFHQAIQAIYSPYDWEQGFIISKNRNGFTQNYNIVSLSIAVVTNQRETPKTIEELSERIAQTKKKCKQQVGDTIIVV
jgi:diguanylate cyclase (GGDEF)-like protein